MVGFAETTVLDVSALFGGGDPALDRAIADVLERERSFAAIGFPNADGLDCRLSELLRFFAMRHEDKLSCATCRFRPANANIYRGFYPLSEAADWSHNEIFDMGPEPTMTVPDVPGAESFREENVWPAVEPVAGWRDAMLELFALKRVIGVAVLAAAARGLGLDEETFVAPARGRNGTLRLLHYAPFPAGFELRNEDSVAPGLFADGRQQIGSAHIDTGLVSVLWQDQSAGLQMRGADEVWREVPWRSNLLSIHLGDLVQALSGNRLKGTMHRVLGDGGDRCSAGLFVEPDFETQVVAPSDPAPVSYARHLVNEFPGRFEAPLES